MSTFTESASAAQEAVLSSVKQSQELTLKAIGAWTETATKAVPASWLEPIQLPVEPRELVDASFGFAGELLAAQRDFAAKLLDTLPASKAAKPKAAAK